MTERTETTSPTHEEEQREARSAHDADRPPTPEDEVAAERGSSRFKGDEQEVAEHFEEMAERGATVRGEGEID